jgi:WD40 repeat protein/serine/threonine protein kinase
MAGFDGDHADNSADTPTLISENQNPGRADGGRKRASGRIGEFTLIREIGRGGMGVVYEAFQESLRRTVALKVLPLAGRIDQRQIKRFENESFAVAQLDHPNIVPVYCSGDDGGVHYYAMKLIPGNDLACIIRHARDIIDSKCARPSAETPAYMGTTAWAPSDDADKTRVPSVPDTTTDVPSSAASHRNTKLIQSLASRKPTVASPKVFEPFVDIIVQAAEALHHAHELGIVHRDIKPSNLLLDDDGKLWIADFGLAHVQGVDALTMSGEVVGTLRYMSPEQPLGNRVLVDQRTDIYSLGITLYELLTLKKAFGGDTPKEVIKQVCFDDPVSLRRLNPMVPPDLETIVMKAIAKNPADRYQTAAELAEDLRRFIRDEPILARRPTLAQRCRRWIRRHMLLTTSMAVAVVALMLTSVTASLLIYNSMIRETQQRKRAESLLSKSEGLRLAANSAQQLETNPALAMLLGIRSSELTMGVDSGTAVLRALSRNHELRTFSPRSVPTDRFHISPDGGRIVSTAGRNDQKGSSFPVIVSDLNSGESLLTLTTDFATTSAVYSPDGRFLLTTPASVAPAEAVPGDAAATLRSPELWDALTGARRLVFAGAALHAAVPHTFSPASDRVALFGPDHSVQLYSTTDGRLELSLTGHTSEIRSAVFSLDGNRVLTVGSDRTIRVWDSASGAELRVFTFSTVQPESLSAEFVGDSQTIIVSANDGTRLMSVEKSEQLNSQHWHETKSIISRDGRWIALMLPLTDRIVIRARHSGRIISEIVAPAPVTSASFSPDGRLLLLTTFTNTALFRTDDGAQVASLNGHTEFVNHGTFTPDGTKVATTSEDGTVRLWSVRSGEERMTLTPRPARVVAYPYTTSSDSALIGIATEPTSRAELRGPEGQIIAGEFLGRISHRRCKTDRLVTWTDHEVLVWSFPTSRRIASISLHDKVVRSAIVVPNSSWVVLLIEGGPTWLWDTDNNDKRLLVDPNVAALDCDPHPSDGRIALSLEDGRCVLMDSATGQIEHNLRHEGQVVSVAFSHDGAQLLTVDDRNAAHLWRGEEPKEVLTIQGPGVHLNRAAFSGDDAAILTWSALRHESVRAWSTQDGTKLGELPPMLRPRVEIHDTLSLAAISSTDGLLLWNWSDNQQTPLTSSEGKCSVFLGNRLLSIEQSEIQPAEGVPAEGKSATNPNHREFVPWVLNVRDIMTEQLVSTSPLTKEPWNLSADASSQQAVLSFRTHDVSVVDMKTHETLASAGRHAAPIIFQGFSVANRSVVCASKDHTVSIWTTGGQQLHLLSGHHREIASASLSSDGKHLVTFDTSGRGIQWNVQEGTQVREFVGHSGPVSTARFSASGKKLLTVGSDRTIRLWDLIGRTDAEFKFDQNVQYAELSPDERFVLAVEGPDGGSPKAAANLQSPRQNSPAILLQTDTEARTFLNADGSPLLGRIRPDGQQLAILSEEGIVRLYDMASGEVIQSFDPNRRLIHDMAFSPDSRQFLVMHSGELSLWDLDSGMEQLRIPHRGPFRFPSTTLTGIPEWKPFSPDGNWIITSTDQLKKWPRHPLKEALQRRPRTLSNEEIRQFSINMLSEE